jgi:hypothetical protein
MTAEKTRMAETILKDGENYPGLSDIIKDLWIGRTTFYRYFPPRTDLQAKATELKNLEKKVV